VKSIVRVVQVVDLLLWTSNLFQLTCPWTSEKNLISGCLKNTILFPKVAANTNTQFESKLLPMKIKVKIKEQFNDKSF